MFARLPKAIGLLVVLSVVCFGQESGIPTFGAADAHEIDTIDLVTYREIALHCSDKSECSDRQTGGQLPCHRV
jgi:hypothetical protein